MRRGVDPARATADHRHAYVSELVGELARAFRAVRGHLPRSDQRDSILVLRGELPFDIKDDGRIVNLPERLRVFLILLRDHAATEFLSPFQFGAEIDGAFPI